LNIKKRIYNNKVTFEVSGRLDIESISSVGIRVVLILQKQMKKQRGKLIILNVNEFVMDVLETTNIAQILDIQ
jgi:anti-anti-sigma factor